MTGHDVDDSEEDSDANTNTLSLAAIVVNTDSQKRNRGAPKMQKQKRVTHHYTELVYSAKSKADLTKRRSNLGFVLKKTSNNCKLTYFKCVTHKSCSYTELVRKGEAGTGFYAHVFTKINPHHTQEFAERLQSRTNGICERWIRMVDTLISTGRAPMQIRTHLLLQANKSTDKSLAIQSLQFQSPKIRKLGENVLFQKYFYIYTKKDRLVHWPELIS